MWAYDLVTARRFEPTEINDSVTPAVGEVTVRLQAGGICGSDIPKFAGDRQRGKRDAPGAGFPMHEIAGAVEESADPRFAVGDQVCGYAAGQAGLRELVVTPAETLTHAPAGLTAVESTVVQPLSTVLYALDRLPDVRGHDALVVGLGPIGLLFCHALDRAGARVIGVDPIDRSDVAKTFGIDELFVGGIEDWRPADVAAGTAGPTRCIEAVGHQQSTLTDIVHASGPEAHVIAFGVPDDETYTFPMRAAFDRGIVGYFGTTQRWEAVLGRAATYLDEHREILDDYITHVLPLDRVNEAYTLASQPAVDRRKVVVDVRQDHDSSR